MKRMMVAVVEKARLGCFVAGTLLAMTASGDVVTWTGGAGDGAWETGGNWDAGVPVAGDAVIVSNAVIEVDEVFEEVPPSIALSGATPRLLSFEMSGGTLTFSGNAAQLDADTVTLSDEAVVTHAPWVWEVVDEEEVFTWEEEVLVSVTTNITMGSFVSNRVYVTCDTLTVGDGAAIDATGKGYQAVSKGSGMTGGQGPGAGYAISSSATGGAHGGIGGYSNHYGNRPDAYGEADFPVLAGSSGGSVENQFGGHGGGVVRVVASGAVTVDGTVTAAGGNPERLSPSENWRHNGGGAGGSVWIAAETISGTGLISAAGGAKANEGGGGAGGRMKLEYDGVAQATLMASETTPQLNVNSSPNATSGREQPILLERVAAQGIVRDQVGSLWLTDAALLRKSLAVVGIARIYNVTAWTLDALTIDGGRYLCFEEGAFHFDVTGSLAVSGTGSGLWVAPSNQVLTVGEDFTVASGGAVWIEQRGVTVDETEWEEFGGMLEIGGELTVGSGGTLYLVSEPWAGASTKIVAGNATVASGGVISANAFGFMSYYGYNGNPPGRGVSPGSSGGGGGHGGVGGHGAHSGTLGGAVYGDALRPILAGSCGGAHTITNAGTGVVTYPFYGGSGGGVIWIEAPDGTITVNGTVSANGGVSPVSGNSGHGSGGSVYLVGDCIAGTGTVQADGFDNNSEGGGGGGGRIAIAGWSDYRFFGSLSALGGRFRVFNDLPAGDGTVELVPGPGYLFTVSGEPYNYGASSPYDYGQYAVGAGLIAMEVTPTANVTATAQELCTGYVWEDDTPDGGSGTAPNVNLVIKEDTRLTWIWTNQWMVTVQGGGAEGSLEVNGIPVATATNFWNTHAETVTVEAFANPNWMFVQWVGDGVTPDMAFDNPLAIAVERSWDLTAAFVSTFPETRTWTGGTGAFETAGNWSPAGIPGPQDILTIAEGEVSLSNPWQLQSITVEGTGRLILSGASTRLTALDSITVAEGGVISHAPIGTDDLTQVWLVAPRVEIAAGAAIDVAGKGYAGGAQGSNNGKGPSGGLSGSNSGSGGGHGGAGTNGSHNNAGGAQVGDASAPTLAGSGGAGCSNGAGGAGGGVVKIEAEVVVLEGDILASGLFATGNAGGGAGGSVWIVAETLSGAGSIRADGGGAAGTPPLFNEGGGGGGGRVRIDVDAVKQGVAAPFTGWMSVDRSNGRQGLSQAGTVWLDDAALFPADDPTHLVRLNSFVHGVSAWTAAGDTTVAYGRITFVAASFEMAFNGNVTVFGPTSGLEWTMPPDAALRIPGTLTLTNETGTAAIVEALYIRAQGGSVTCEGESEPLTENMEVIPGGVLSVGKLSIGENMRLRVAGCPLAGGPLKIEAESAVIDGTLD
ncbi:MAG: hypothetical protein FWF84_04650, partial [Kiritimatiellaeota bacterium]|nr:hypothetical protein [Kiritimatiellota bacterium]